MDGVADDKTVFEWIRSPDSHRHFLLVDRQYVEAWIEVEDDLAPNSNRRWRVGNLEGVVLTLHAAICEVMAQLLPAASSKERSERWSIHDAKWRRITWANGDSMRLVIGTFILADVRIADEAKGLYSWATIFSSTDETFEGLNGSEREAILQAERALFDPAALHGQPMDTSEIDQEQLKRTAEALDWVKDY